MSSSLFGDLDFLVYRGKNLQNLLYKARSKSSLEERGDIHWDVRSTVTDTLHEIKNSRSMLYFSHESIISLVNKIRVTLDELIILDSRGRSVYEDLIKQLGEFKRRNPAWEIIDDLRRPYSSSPEDDIDSPQEPDFDAAFDELSGEEQNRLRCFLLYPSEAEIKRREIIHCWVGLGLSDSLVGECQLDKLVGTGLIRRRMLNKKLLNRYKMPQSVRHKLQGLDQKSDYMSLIIDKKSWSILHANKEQQSGNNKAFIGSRLRTFTKSLTFTPSLPVGNVDPEALLNLYSNTLTDAQLKTVCGMQKLKVVHLGICDDSRRYIFVDDVKSFKYLKTLKQVAFLSLAGVMGIEKLPQVVYELRQLKVLDLKGCGNLEVLPSGIESLINLTHLDLSECYVLDSVPLGIKFLTNLQVLKGFVVNYHPGMGIEKKGKKISTGSPCRFSELSKLNQLRKLTILNKRRDFPTKGDLLTLCEMEQLSILRVVWAQTFDIYDECLTDEDDDIRFPAKLMKLDLQGVPNENLSRLTRLISEDANNHCLEKLYLRGGGLRELKHLLAHPKIVRLRFLTDLQIHWHDFAKLFPNLCRLEVFECPKVISFPCDANGMWERQC